MWPTNLPAQSYQTDTRTFPHRQTCTKIHLATNGAGQATEVSMDEGNRQRGRGRDTHRVQLSLGKSALYQIRNCGGRLSGGARDT